MDCDSLVSIRDDRSAPFAWVSMHGLKTIRRDLEPKAQASARNALFALAEAASDRYDGKHREGDTLRELAALAGTSTRRLRDHLATLADLGLVTIESRVDSSGRDLPTVYVLANDSGGDKTSDRVDESSAETSDLTGARPSQPSAAQARQPEERTKNGRAPVVDDEHRTVTALFEHWQLRCNHPTSKPTRERRQKIAARLREGYTPDQIRAAIDGAARDPFVNDAGKRFDDLELICRTGSKLESFIDRAAPPLAGNGTVHPIRPPQGQARNANGKPTHAELIGELRAANPRLHPELAVNHQLPART
jgi:hypothetical protein